MATVANLSANLTANTSSFDANLNRAGQRLARTSRSMSRSAETLNNKISLSFRQAAQSAAAFDGPLGGIAGRLSTLATIAGTTGVALGGATLALSAFGIAAVKAARVGDDFEGRLNQINALLRTTGNASGQSAEGIRRFAQELARGTLASVEGVENAAITLLSFRRISGDTFTRAITLAQDLSATFKTDLKSSILQIGKALEDPVLGITALSRSGVTFTQTQKDVIKALVETGQVAQAQKLILDELSQTVGGAGAAEGGGLSKALDSASQSAENFFLALNDRLGASTIFAKFVTQIDRDLQSLADTLNGTKAPLVDQLREAFEQLNFLTAQQNEEIQRLIQSGRSASDARDYVQGEIENQYKLIDAINEQIIAEENKTKAARKAGEETQKKIAAEAELGRQEERRQKLAEQAAKEEERRQKLIKDTVENMEQAVLALDYENQLLATNILTVEQAAAAREALLLQQKLGLEADSAEAQKLDELIDKRTKLKEAIKKETEDRKKAEQIIKDNRTELEKLKEQLDEINRLKKEGLLADEEAAKASDKLNVKIRDLSEGQQKLNEVLADTGSAARSAFKDFVTGAKSAGDAIRDFGLRILDMLADQSINALFSGIGGALFGKDNQSGLIGGFISGLFSGEGFADGGRPPVGQASIVGERGPELFIPDTAGTIISNDNLMSGGNNGPTIYADMRGASVEAVQRLENYVNQINGSIEPRAVNAVVTEKERNPALFKAD